MKVLSVILVLCAGLLVSAHGSWVNTEVARTVDLKTHIVKISSVVSMKNKGSPTNTFDIAIEPQAESHLAYLEVVMVDEEDSSTKIKKSAKDASYTVTLPNAVEADKTVKVRIEEYFTHLLKPFPSEITQSQKQLVTYSGNVLFYSPYETEVQTTTVELFSNVLEDFTKHGTTEQDQSTIKYGGSSEYDNVKPLTEKSISLHFENNSPFLTVTEMTRVIEVSHWGNIAVEETIDIQHTGARFKGSFSRYDFQRLPNSGVSAVKSFKTILPASSTDVYYRDLIGNISTSNLLVQDDSVEMDIRPRFPLFGGWKTNYHLGYNLPSYTYLYKTGELHALRMRFVDHVYDDMAIDKLTLKIILPEGCKQISVSMPYETERMDDSLHFTYLDTVGRPVLTFTKTNLVEQHIKDFTISYNFSQLMLLQEPLLLVGAFFLMFFTVIIIVRLDFSITHSKISEARLRVQSVIEKVQEHQAKRSSCYNLYESAIRNYKHNKDHTALSNSRKTIEKTHKETTAAISQLLPKLREDGADCSDKRVKQKKWNERGKRGFRAAEKSTAKENIELETNSVNKNVYVSKVSDIMKKDRDIMEKYSQSVQLAEKLVNKKLTKDQYVEMDKKNQKLIDDWKEAIADMTDNL